MNILSGFNLNTHGELKAKKNTRETKNSIIGHTHPGVSFLDTNPLFPPINR